MEKLPRSLQRKSDLKPIPPNALYQMNRMKRKVPNNQTGRANPPMQMNFYVYGFLFIYSCCMKVFRYSSYWEYMALRQTEFVTHMTLTFCTIVGYDRTIARTCQPSDTKMLIPFLVVSNLLLMGVNYVMLYRQNKYLKLYKIYLEKRTLAKDLLCVLVYIGIISVFVYIMKEF